MNTSNSARFAVLLAALATLNNLWYMAYMDDFSVPLVRTVREELSSILPRASNSTSHTPQNIIPSPSPTSSPTASPAPLPVDFMNKTELDQKDVFSAAWWQTIERFLSADLDLIKTVEGDSFIPIKRAGRGGQDARKTRDYLDFSIEHLSKWWKMTQAPGVQYAIRKLESYVQRSVVRPESSIMNTTLALIPYGVSDKHDDMYKRMWETALSATIASLLKQGVPRVVVVGTFETDAQLTARVFTELTMNLVKPSQQFETFFDTTGAELAYVHTDNVHSEIVKINVPKGALHGLRDALKGEKDPEPYLGRDKDRFKYVYMTEADQILNTRLTTEFLDVLNKGRIIVPHRLQPIPHAQDVDQFSERPKSLYQLPPPKTVIFLSADTDGCCDTGAWLQEQGKTCNTFWWQCGFGNNAKSGAGNFSHLQDYDFISLTQGTGIVSLAATEQSRRCTPAPQNRGCPRVVESVPARE